MKTIFENKSKYWSGVVLSIAVLGILFILYDRLFGSYLLLNLGGILFSISGIMIGIEAILNRKIILRSPYHRRLSETYTGITAIAQGLIIIITGLSLIGLIVLNYLNFGHSLFHYFVQHPGFPFVFLAVICFLTSIISILGSKENKQVSKLEFILNLLTSRFLAGTILILFGIIFLSLGILEIIDPSYFDSLGGGFLEVVFLSRQSK